MILEGEKYYAISRQDLASHNRHKQGLWSNIYNVEAQCYLCFITVLSLLIFDVHLNGLDVMFHVQMKRHSALMLDLMNVLRER